MKLIVKIVTDYFKRRMIFLCLAAVEGTGGTEDKDIFGKYVK